MVEATEADRREADPTIVGDDRPFWHKAEIWYLGLPIVLVSTLIVGIRYAAGESTVFDVAWFALVLLAVLVFPFWSWYLEPTPVDHPPGEVDEPSSADDDGPA